MSDDEEDWRAFHDSMRKQSQERRRNNRETSTALLERRRVQFETKNDGVHLIVEGKDGLIDFWPGTGKFIIRSGGGGRGVFNLLKHCRVSD